MHFVITSMMKGCPNVDFKSVGFIPKELASFLHSECAGCDKLQICTGYLAQHTGLSDKKEEVHNTLHKCLNCKDLDNCLHYYMTQLNISKVAILKQAFLMKFRNCSEEKKMMISLDLPPDAEGANVGSALRKIEKKEEPKA